MRANFRSIGTLACAVVISACTADQVAAPGIATPTVDQAADAGRLKTSTRVAVHAAGLFRAAPLAEAITVAKIIGSNGGKISIPSAGVTITVPAGALAAPIEISVTARKGRLIAYDFQPHGTTFAKPLVISQQLVGTNASPSNLSLLKLGYYANPNLLTSDGALVSEEIDGALSTGGQVFTSTISHFSGYLISCGRRPSVDEGER